MQLNEVCRRVELSKRAVKYYEEQGLLSVGKDANGYRNYTEENVAILQKIAVYRKLGISIHDIRRLLAGSDDGLLEQIYETKAEEIDFCHICRSGLQRPNRKRLTGISLNSGMILPSGCRCSCVSADG